MAQDTITVKDGDGSTEKIQAVGNSDGSKSWITVDKPFELAVNQGLISGHSVIDKFGFNQTITTGTDPEDVWEGGGTYSYDDTGTAPIQYLSSSNAGDTTQSIKIQGIDIDGNLVTQTATLTGQSPVTLATPLWRVFRMENEADEGGELAGTVYCGTDSAPALGVPATGQERALIEVGNEQTQMALYTVPLGYVGFLYYGELALEQESTGLSSNEYANCAYKSRRVGKVFKTKKTIPLNVQGSTIYQEVRRFPDIVPALTDIKLTVNEVSAEIGVSGAFDILLVEEGELNSSFLTAIEQPTEMPS